MHTKVTSMILSGMMSQSAEFISLVVFYSSHLLYRFSAVYKLCYFRCCIADLYAYMQYMFVRFLKFIGLKVETFWLNL